MSIECTLAPAIITPFNDDGSIDFESLGVLIEHVIGGGVDGIVVLGTTGESSTLTPSERLSVFEFVAQKSAGRVELIAGIGGNNTAEIATLCKEFPYTEHYSAILSVCPYYTKPIQTGLYEHFRYIAENSTLPILLYNVPSRTGVNLEAQTVIALSHDCPTIIGIKEASGNMEQIEHITEGAKEGFRIYSGDDMLSDEIIALGGVGCIGVLPNAFPSQFKSYIDSALSGDLDTVETSKAFLDTFNKYMYTEGNPTGIKALLSEMGMCRNILRLPLLHASDQLQQLIKKTI